MSKKLMTGRWWVSAIAAASLLALVGWLGATEPAEAAVTKLAIGSATVPPGGEATVSLTADATAPGIGSYGVDVVYDGSKVDDTACTSSKGICTRDLVAANTIRISGSDPAGITGTGALLGTITFKALPGATGVANLTVTVVTLTDNANPPVALTVTPTNGTITIAAETATPTGTPGTATATPPATTPARLPPSGGAPSDGFGVASWLLVALGLAVIGGGIWVVARIRRENS